MRSADDPLTIRYDYWIEEPYSHSPLTPGPSPARGEGCVVGLEGGGCCGGPVVKRLRDQGDRALPERDQRRGGVVAAAMGGGGRLAANRAGRQLRRGHHLGATRPRRANLASDFPDDR